MLYEQLLYYRIYRILYATYCSNRSTEINHRPGAIITRGLTCRNNFHSNQWIINVQASKWYDERAYSSVATYFPRSTKHRPRQTLRGDGGLERRGTDSQKIARHTGSEVSITRSEFLISRCVCFLVSFFRSALHTFAKYFDKDSRRKYYAWVPHGEHTSAGTWVKKRNKGDVFEEEREELRERYSSRGI